MPHVTLQSLFSAVLIFSLVDIHYWWQVCRPLY